MTRDEVQKDLVQKALDTRDANGRMRCTIEAITGLGKTFISFHLIRDLQPKTVLFLAETELREQNIRDDIIKYAEIFGYNIFAKHKVEFMCYQSAYKKVDMYHEMVIADEIHDSLTPAYFKYYNNNRYIHLLGLSATIDKRTTYKDEVGNEYTKIDMLNSIAPIAATYTVKQGQQDRTSRELTITIIEHDLDTRKKCIPVEYKDKSTGVNKIFFQTEYEYYQYCHSRYIQSFYSPTKSEFLTTFWRNKRNNILYSLPSKTRAVIELLSKHELNRNIVFGNAISQLLEICPTVSSKNSPAVNAKLITDFNEGRLNTIGSFKMLKQGANLNNLDNVIMHSYYSVDKDFIQRIGRLRNKETEGNVIIFMTRGTQEENWLEKIMTATDLKFNRCRLENFKL